MSSQVHGCAALYPEFGAVSRFIQSSSDGDGREHLTNTHMAPRGNYSTKNFNHISKTLLQKIPALRSFESALGKASPLSYSVHEPFLSFFLHTTTPIHMGGVNATASTQTPK
jgi:hypothetical protein